MSLDDDLLAAHATGDIPSLITLYARAADAATELVPRAFYLTHAYIFALEAGDARATGLADRLRAMGRL